METTPKNQRPGYASMLFLWHGVRLWRIVHSIIIYPEATPPEVQQEG